MPTIQYKTPGVYREDLFPAPEFRLLTGVPAFLGFASKGPVNTPQRFTQWPKFEETFGASPSDGYLAQAVRGFLANDGSVCYVVRLDEASNAVAALNQGLTQLEALEVIDLVCAPDIMRPSQAGAAVLEADVQRMQRAVLSHCERLGDRLALLDALPGASNEKILAQRRGLSGQGLSGANGALYYPWIWVPQPGSPLGKERVPPCGHVAGVYARSDQRVGVHKAPANELLEGVVDLEVNLTDAQQGDLNSEGINCLRAFPGRGLRVWGARTLSADPAWTYVNVRRLFLTVGRWLDRTMADVAFEPNDFLVWVRIERELRAYFTDLFRQGALKGATEDDAFYVKCDVDTNPPAVRDAGMVVTEIGLAPAIPNEFVVVRLIHGASGVTIAGPTRPA
jgi:uncharacterized protein